MLNRRFVEKEEEEKKFHINNIFLSMREKKNRLKYLSKSFRRRWSFAVLSWCVISLSSAPREIWKMFDGISFSHGDILGFIVDFATQQIFEYLTLTHTG
jgi:hypothetical protein